MEKKMYSTAPQAGTIPQSQALPQVFSGGSHALILFANGDLYAIGNNRHGACGADFPEQLDFPIRIARGVKHAAASRNHSAYVKEDGSIVLIGCSDLADRFSSNVRADRIYARNDADSFLILDAVDNTWFFGENRDDFELGIVRQSVVLKKLPTIMTTCLTDTFQVFRYGSGGCPNLVNWYSCNTYQDTSLKDEADRILRQPWYLEYVRMCGEKNLSLQMDVVAENCLSSDTRRTEEVHRGHTECNTKLKEQTVCPTVVQSNSLIYQPIPCNFPERDSRELNHFLSLKTYHDRLPYLGKDPEKVIMESGLSLSSDKAIAYLDESKVFHYLHSTPRQSHTTDIPGIMDFATFMASGYPHLLLVNSEGRILLADKSDPEVPLWDHQQALTFYEEMGIGLSWKAPRL